jgi:hypothetical protein
LKVTVDVDKKPVPLMVSVCGVAPAVRVAGDRDVTVGTGLLAVTAKLTATDDPPPGAAFVTTTG